MFNLLRRSVNRKSRKNKSNYETNVSDVDVDDEDGVSSSTERAIARNYVAERLSKKARKKTASDADREKEQPEQHRESYRQFSEKESDRESARVLKPYRRAVIDELDDFGEFDCEEKPSSPSSSLLLASPSLVKTTDNDNFYFELWQPQAGTGAAGGGERGGERAGSNAEKEYEKVKLAKTAAKFSSHDVDGAVDADVDGDVVVDEDAVEKLWREHITRYRNTKSNSANELSKSVLDVNNINKIEAFRRAGDGANDEATVASESDVRHWCSKNTGRSQNEEAKWQGHAVRSSRSSARDDNDNGRDQGAFHGTNVSLIGKTIKPHKISDDDEDEIFEEDNQNDERTIEQFNSSISQDRLSGNKKTNSIEQSQVEDVEKSNAFGLQRNTDSTTTTTTTAAATARPTNDRRNQNSDRSEATTTTTSRARHYEPPVDTVINEVKYRNNDNSTSATKTNQASNEFKRQSRLSLTNFGFGRIHQNPSNHEIEQIPRDTRDTNIKTNKYPKTEQPQQHQQHETTPKKSSTFIFGRKHTNSCCSDSQNSQTKRSALKPLQKSREFFSDIFMARGRNHNNRNRHTNTNTNSNSNHNQTNHQAQSQPQPQPQHHHHQNNNHPNPKHQHQQQKSSKVIDQTHTSSATSLTLPPPPPQTQAISEMTIENDIIMDYVVVGGDGSVDGDNDDDDDNKDLHHHHQRTAHHLETNSDPAVVSTNNYQMTASNNSNKNFYRSLNGEQEKQSPVRESANASKEQTRVTGENDSNSANAESTEEDEDGDGDANANAANDVDEEDEITGVAGVENEIDHVDRVDGTEHDFIHAANVEQHGVESSESIAKAVVDSCHNEDNINLTECVRDRLLQQHQNNINTNENGNNNNNNNNNNVKVLNSSDRDRDRVQGRENNAAEPCSDITTPSMGQSQSNGNAKSGASSVSTSQNGSRASTPREFRESILPESDRLTTQPVVVPKITIVDYGNEASTSSTGAGVNEMSPKEKEIFYDFEPQAQRDHGVNITSVDDAEGEHSDGDQDDDDVDDDDDDDVFETVIPTTVHQQQYQQQQQQQRWTRLSHVKLENVPEQEEDEDEEDGEEEDEDEGNDDDEDDEEEEEQIDRERELYNQRHTRATSSSDKRGPSTERTTRSPLKSTNTSDSNLSTSYPDSGIGIESFSSQTSSVAATTATTATTTSVNEPVGTSLPTRSNFGLRLPFVRDGNSTDCDESLMQCDEFNDDDFLISSSSSPSHHHQQYATHHPHERLVCIESISLPDVVVESTTASNASSCGSVNTAASSTAAQNGGEQILNINGATGNSVGNVHFIPIHVEGGGSSNGSNGRGSSCSRSRSGSPKQPQAHRSFDDSCIGSKRTYAQLNDHTMPPTIEIIEDASCVFTPTTTADSTTRTDTPKISNGYETEILKQELNEQRQHYSAQIEDAQKNVHNLENKVGLMQTKIEKLEQELSLKTWNVERLQGELNAAHKDDEYVRKKLKLLEDEKTSLRHKFSENEDESQKKYEELETQYNELTEKYKQTQSLASNLQTQLATAQVEAEEWRGEVEKIRGELEEQIRILKNALENSEAERKICEDKWQKEFEMVRTHNIEREESLMTDCEWQVRQMQRQCKDKTDKAIHERNVAQAKAAELAEELEQRKEAEENLRVYEAQVNSLRGVVTEQEHSIKTLMERIESLQTELETANENLETQIEAVAKIKYQCDNAIYDKERQMIYRIDEVRNEAAAFWEDKLYTEMTRLKNELESVYVDERRDALDKLQLEHIEELRALTTRYTANEDELRAELEEVQDRLDRKCDEFLELREKSDNTLLQTRMHLDRADRDYQNAMCREEQRREELEEKMQKVFEAEKQEMEEKFRERLGQVKDEFAKELQLSTQDMVEKHRKALEHQKAKLLAEKEEALQELADRHRKKLAAAEERIKEIELRHQRDLKDLKAAYDAEKAALDKRDISNANEIEMLHRKCRCLTNLFEEMRMRYERRDPRQEDLREIAELRSRCESQERDLYVLTDRLREMQIQMNELQQNGNKSGGKQVKKPPPKTIPTSCDVIYEENEERESPPPTTTTTASATTLTSSTTNHRPQQRNGGAEEINDDAEDDDEEEEEGEEQETDQETEDGGEQSDTESNHKIEIKDKKNNVDTLNEDDAHMITAV